MPRPRGRARAARGRRLSHPRPGAEPRRIALDNYASGGRGVVQVHAHPPADAHMSVLDRKREVAARPRLAPRPPPSRVTSQIRDSISGASTNSPSTEPAVAPTRPGSTPAMPGAGERIPSLQGALPELFPDGKVARPHVVPPPDSTAWLVPGTVAAPRRAAPRASRRPARRTRRSPRDSRGTSVCAGGGARARPPLPSRRDSPASASRRRARLAGPLARRGQSAARTGGRQTRICGPPAAPRRNRPTAPSPPPPPCRTRPRGASASSQAACRPRQALPFRRFDLAGAVPRPPSAAPRSRRRPRLRQRGLYGVDDLVHL